MSEFFGKLLLTLVGALAGPLFAYYRDKLHSPYPGRYQGKIWHYVGAAFIGGGVMFLVSWLLISPGFFTPSRGVTAIIEVPADGSLVPHAVTLQGKIIDMPEGSSVWLFVIPADSSDYHPQSGPLYVGTDGRWSGTVYIGKSPKDDIGKYFTLIIGLAGPTGSDLFRDYLAVAMKNKDYRGIGVLPSDVRPLSQVQVQRR